MTGLDEPKVNDAHSFTTSKDVISVCSLSPRNASKRSKAAWPGQPNQPAQLQLLFSLLEPFAFLFPVHSLLFHSCVCVQQLPMFLVWALPKKRDLESRCWWRKGVHCYIFYFCLSTKNFCISCSKNWLNQSLSAGFGSETPEHLLDHNLIPTVHKLPFP